MSAPPADLIARRFRPSRYRYHYVKAKLRSDPLYPAVAAALHGSALPLLDVGCGLGLLAHTLHAAGHAAAYLGVDHDGAKIAHAGAAAADLPRVRFLAQDARAALPPHAGDVALLDVLQYLAAESQAALLADCVRRLAPGGRLVVRTGLRDDSWRYRLTHLADVVGRASRWMKCGRILHPAQAEVDAALLAARPDLRLHWSPLHQGTPFNNHLLVAALPA